MLLTINFVKTQTKKLEKLCLNTVRDNETTCVKTVNDLVDNLSDEQFSEEELELLNRGLNFSVAPDEIQINDAIVDIESAIHYKPFGVKARIRKKADEVLKSINTTNNNNKWNNALNSLRKRNVFYTKSDKGNKIVILKKEDYDRRMIESIAEENFIKTRFSPLSRMCKDAKKTQRLNHESIPSSLLHFESTERRSTYDVRTLQTTQTRRKNEKNRIEHKITVC
ncbi:uncharacterized protein LOC129573275 [Sitodiplosis mosellana]|uniref:uncharacterized protein LOC129573275 n=1 Tax=Sitodiplosis mosellana TaxID=263140 RepID=UPI0024439B90|nr:uncharacterized protein LOC129573275 [Sitodiplosis mosellana]